jgi:hypothetical protein
MDWGFVNVDTGHGDPYKVACFAMICHHCGERYIEFFPNAKQENLFIGTKLLEKHFAFLSEVRREECGAGKRDSCDDKKNETKPTLIRCKRKITENILKQGNHDMEDTQKYGRKPEKRPPERYKRARARENRRFHDKDLIRKVQFVQ